MLENRRQIPADSTGHLQKSLLSQRDFKRKPLGRERQPKQFSKFDGPVIQRGGSWNSVTMTIRKS